MNNFRAQIEEQVVTPFCKALKSSVHVAKSGRDFAEDTSDLIAAMQGNQMQGLSEILAEKRREIVIQKELVGELIRFLTKINTDVIQVRSVTILRARGTRQYSY